MCVPLSILSGAVTESSYGFTVGGYNINIDPNYFAFIFKLNRRKMTAQVRRMFGPLNNFALRDSNIYMEHFPVSANSDMIMKD